MEMEFSRDLTGSPELPLESIEKEIEPIEIGDALVLRRKSNGHVTKPMPVLELPDNEILFGRGYGRSQFKYWYGTRNEDGTITSRKGVEYEVVERRPHAADKEAAISMVWQICVRSSDPTYETPPLPVLTDEDRMLLARAIVHSQSVLNTQKKLERALLILFEGDCRLVIRALVMTVEKYVEDKDLLTQEFEPFKTQ